MNQKQLNSHYGK